MKDDYSLGLDEKRCSLAASMRLRCARVARLQLENRHQKSCYPFRLAFSLTLLSICQMWKLTRFDWATFHNNLKKNSRSGLAQR